jgi:hypothetical protein
MSALGQKQTYAPQQAMSALHLIATTKADVCQWFPPKADIDACLHDVRFTLQKQIQIDCVSAADVHFDDAPVFACGWTSVQRDFDDCRPSVAPEGSGWVALDQEVAMPKYVTVGATALFVGILCATPVSLRISPEGIVSLSLTSATAEIGRPLTATSVAGVHRRQARRAYRRGYSGYGEYNQPYRYGYGTYQPYSNYAYGSNQPWFGSTNRPWFGSGYAYQPSTGYRYYDRPGYRHWTQF